jgi:hypothetical protein
MPENLVHLLLRTYLFQLLQHSLGGEHSVGSEQFVYWLPTNPRRCLAPDVLVKLGVAQTLFATWKTWRHGAPDLAVEIVSPSEGSGITWEDKLDRYREMGVSELVRFDPDAHEGTRLRVWDRLEEDLVERVVDAERTTCVTLGWTWVVMPIEGCPVGLRLERDSGDLVATSGEEALFREQAAKERARVAEGHVRELEAELAKLRGERD